MLSKINTMQLIGVTASGVTVETDVSNGLPAFNIVGQPDQTVKESRERLRIAINSSGLYYPNGRITVNLCPAELKKKGSHFDLAVAVGILAASGQICSNNIHEYGFLGELSLDGILEKTKGILPMVMELKNRDIKKVIVPFTNADEAAFVSGIEVYPAQSLKEVVDHLNEKESIKFISDASMISVEEDYYVDFADVKGQEEVKRAIIISVAGNHGLFMVGSPGAGKTMLAERIPTVMPPMTKKEMIEATAIYSVAGLLNEDVPVISQRPFRHPHYKITLAGLIGGGKNPVPGEITLAHKGVLFLDEIGEFSGGILDSLRAPMENKNIIITRTTGTTIYPSDFLLIAASNPCKCGYYGDSNHKCTCSFKQVLNYQRKISGPILERIDMHINVNEVKYDDLQQQTGMDSAYMRSEIERVRNVQIERYREEDITLNSQLTNKNIDTYASLGYDEEKFLRKAYKTFKLSPRTLMRIRKVARTIADLDGAEIIEIKHIAESLKFRGVSMYD